MPHELRRPGLVYDPGYIKAFVEYSIRHSTEGEAFSEWLKSL